MAVNEAPTDIMISFLTFIFLYKFGYQYEILIRSFPSAGSCLFWV